MSNKEIILIFWLTVIFCFILGCILHCVFDIKEKMKEEDKNKIRVEPPRENFNTETKEWLNHLP